MWTRRRDLIHVWALGAAGLALYDSQIVTGITVENYHWLYVWGPCLSFLLCLMVAALLPEHGNRARIAFACLLAAALADVGAGIWLRSVESLRNRGTQQLLANYRRYRDQRLVPGAAKLVPNAVVAGDTPFIDYAGILENLRPLDNYWVFLSPYISDAEWDQRKALNSYLCDPAASESSLRESLSGVNWTPNRIDDEQRRITKRLAIFRTLGPDLDATLDLYKVRYVALAADQVAPAYLGRGWTCLQSGPHWQLWERRPITRDTTTSAIEPRKISE